MKREEILNKLDDFLEMCCVDEYYPDAEDIMNIIEKAGLYYKKETIECHVDGVKYVYTEEKLGND